MRDLKRIDRILKMIEKIWKNNPDLRLLQLIGNCFGYDASLYYVEDDKLEERLKKTYKVS